MTSDSPADTATTWPPQWIDAVGPMLRSYSSPDAIIERHGPEPAGKLRGFASAIPSAGQPRRTVGAGDRIIP